MARRGSFGLQPRVAPNVTNQIVALAREYVAKRDAMIMDAWKNGGTFEGKKATDDMVLAYWQEREVGLDKNDPEYEGTKNQIMQLQYGIAQSKADVLHVQGKLSDTAYAQFFINWAKKIPQNSEFYRTLQKDAAGLIESAKAKGVASANAAKTKAFNEFVKGTTAQDIAIGDAMTGALTDLSKTTGLSITGNGDELLSLLMQNVKANPTQYRVLLDTIKAGDPHWDGTLTEGYFSQHIKAATDGYTLIADRAQKDGYVSAYASATNGMASMASWGQNLKVWPVAQSYSVAENAWLKVMADPNSSQMEKLSASNAYSTALTKLAATPGMDVGSKTMIEADAARLLGQDAGDSPSFGTSMLGRPGVDPQTAGFLTALVQTKAAMDANPSAWAYAPVDAKGQFDATGQGALGMVPAGQVQPGAVGVMIPGADGKAIFAMVMAHSVYTVDPSNPNGAPQLAGHQVSYNVGGKTVEMWGYKDARGEPQWSLISPLANGSSTTQDNKGNIFVTPASSVSLPQQIAGLSAGLTDAEKATLAAGGSVTTTSDTSASGKAGVKTSITFSASTGSITSSTKIDQIDAGGSVIESQTTPVQLTTATGWNAAFSQSRITAGSVPGITFASPLALSVQAANDTMTQDQVSKYVSDPGFQAAFMSQTMQTLGIHDPTDSRVAEAWRAISATATAPAARQLQEATHRSDLNYPGAPASAAVNPLSITFGHPELRFPGMPGQITDHFQQQQGAPSGGIQPQLLPGLGLGVPSQTPTGSPAPSITPTGPTPTPSPTAIAPAATPVPTGYVPAPTSAPVPQPSDYGRGK